MTLTGPAITLQVRDDDEVLEPYMPLIHVQSGIFCELSGGCWERY